MNPGYSYQDRGGTKRSGPLPESGRRPLLSSHDPEFLKYVCSFGDRSTGR